jgi:hypothetical protein
MAARPATPSALGLDGMPVGPPGTTAGGSGAAAYSGHTASSRYWRRSQYESGTRWVPPNTGREQRQARMAEPEMTTRSVRHTAEVDAAVSRGDPERAARYAALAASAGAAAEFCRERGDLDERLDAQEWPVRTASVHLAAVQADSLRRQTAPTDTARTAQVSRALTIAAQSRAACSATTQLTRTLAGGAPQRATRAHNAAFSQRAGTEAGVAVRHRAAGSRSRPADYGQLPGGPATGTFVPGPGRPLSLMLSFLTTESHRPVD